jgi:indolepyruvate ferredoxin oxidoreductase, beta subunit
MKPFNIYLIGVGGQGIGLLSEILLRAADHAGLEVKGVDTHGLAQRGGIVVSRLRIGENAHSPLIPGSQADLVVALERHEAVRGMHGILKKGGTLVYYDAVWQPLDVRLKKIGGATTDAIREQAGNCGIDVVKVYQGDLADARMQNIVLLAHIDGRHLIPGVGTGHFRLAMDDLMHGGMLEKNRVLFEEIRAGYPATTTTESN